MRMTVGQLRFQIVWSFLWCVFCIAAEAWWYALAIGLFHLVWIICLTYKLDPRPTPPHDTPPGTPPPGP